MASSKSQIQSNISYYQSQIVSVNAKILALQEAQTALHLTGTSVTYVLESHESIKASYHLAGTPYLNMTEEEEAQVKDISSYFKSQKEFMLSEITSKISHHQLTVASYQSSITSLTRVLASMDN